MPTPAETLTVAPAEKPAASASFSTPFSRFTADPRDVLAEAEDYDRSRFAAIRHRAHDEDPMIFR